MPKNTSKRGGKAPDHQEQDPQNPTHESPHEQPQEGKLYF